MNNDEALCLQSRDFNPSKVQIHHVLVLAIDGERARDDAFFQTAQGVAPCVVSAIRIEFVRASDELIGAALAGFDDIFVAVWPGDFAVAPETFGVIEGDGAFGFAIITSTEYGCASQ